QSLSGLADEALQTILKNKVSLSFDDSYLPPDLQARLAAQQKIGEVTEQLKVGRDWAEMGQAIGIATRGALSAVTDETARFAATTPGKFTMYMVAWKVMGSDFVKTAKVIIVGVPLLCSWMVFFAWWLRKVYGWRRRKVVTEGKRTYELMEPLSVLWAKEWNATCVEVAKACSQKQQIEYPVSLNLIFGSIQFVAFVL